MAMPGSGTLIPGKPRLVSAVDREGPNGAPTPACQLITRSDKSAMFTCES